MQYTPQDLKQVMSSGLLSFPVTDFDANGDFDAKGRGVKLLPCLGCIGAGWSGSGQGKSGAK